MALKRVRKSIYHTRIKRTTNIINIRMDSYNPMTLVVDFEHTIPTNYYIDESEIIYALYIDREFIKEFFEKTTKFQLETFDVNHVLEIFAHPHGGFEFVRAQQTPGNKIRMIFQAKKPEISGGTYNKVYWDNATGSFLTKIMGQQDMSTGGVSGVSLKSGDILNS